MNPAQARVREIQDALNATRHKILLAEKRGELRPLNIHDIEGILDLAFEAIALQQTETYTWPG